MRAFRRGLAVVILLALAVAWAIPADVPGLIARQDDVLLGRYAEGQLVGLALATVVGVLAAGQLLAGVRLREVLVRLGLGIASVALVFAVASIVLWLPAKPRYVEDRVVELVPDAPVPLAGTTRRRQPDEVFHLHRADRPGPARSYPDAPEGFPAADVTLTTDARGFRNPVRPERADVVVAGDSFSEGSMVDDDEAWPARLAAATGWSVYNASVSGGTPRQYLNNLAAFGMDLRPRTVIVSLYEGNDFKRHTVEEPEEARESGLAYRIARLREAAFEDSPLRARMKRWLLGTFGPMRRDAPVPPSEGLSWMPVAVRGADGSLHHYAFEPKRMLRLDWAPERFARSPNWRSTAGLLREMHRLAEAGDAGLVLLYAPSKAHVVLSVMGEDVPPRALRAFAAFEDDDLPPAGEFAPRMLARLDSQEQVFLDFCREERIRCIDTTPPLREALARGEPVYFTYDPHWTRVGHAVVAETVVHALRAGRDGSSAPPSLR